METTFIIPVVRDDFMDRCLETLYATTPPNFYVFVVDQTKGGLPLERWRRRYNNLLVIRTPLTTKHRSGNLGFAKAVNLAAALVETPYLTICNDDVEFIHRSWWPGVMRTFSAVAASTPETPAAIVTPISVKIPHWAIGQPAGDDYYALPYKSTYTDEEWRFLTEEPHTVNERLTIMPNANLHAAELFCSTLPIDVFRRIGPLNERFYPGGGEDYEYARRVTLAGFRCVSTTQSWVFHHWGATRRSVNDPRFRRRLIDEELCWNDMASVWEEFDERTRAGERGLVAPVATIRTL